MPGERVRQIGEDDRSPGGWSPGGDIDTVTALQALKAAVLDTIGGGAPVTDAADLVSVVRKYIETGDFLGHAEQAERVRGLRREHVAVDATVRTVAGGRIAVVESTSRFAVQAAYRHADVVVAVNPQFRRPGAGVDEPVHRKVTICQQRPGHVDLPAVFAALSEREPGWGGSPTVGGSPQGVACATPTEDIVATVERQLLAVRQ